ncbi:MAG: SIR2 family NAD-dependent protein deacylase [Tractidigestivibacter sp.]|jgi:NAD-dependent SIR2 family protein deacetylase|uniref:SIR2 family NAD-dependent protein deacylase n=1 Tax=Tractidigestivibacter sp. TaxID=2847320 RepID=UPI003D9286FC
MSSQTLTLASTRNFSAELARLQEAFDQADAIVVGAGAGLSTAAGFTYSGERFERWLGPWRKRYGFSDMYSGGFYPYDTLAEFWGYWSKSILANRYEAGVGKTYQQLVDLLSERDHFVLTTNVDHQLQLASEPHDKLFYTQGDYGLFQCSKPCHAKTYDNEQQVRAMAAAVDEKIAAQRAAGVSDEALDLSVPEELVPHCPVCGRPMTTNLRCDDSFVEDKGWHEASRRYDRYLRKHSHGRVLYLELGVGGNTPGIIKLPFWRRVAENREATYACVNLGESFAPSQIADRSILLDADIAQVVDALAK